MSDSGLYTCVATSSSGETSWSAFLDVRGLPQYKYYSCEKLHNAFIETQHLLLWKFILSLSISSFLRRH